MIFAYFMRKVHAPTRFAWQVDPNGRDNVQAPRIACYICRTMSEMLMLKTVKPISSAPFSAAAKGAMPFSRWRAMFSITKEILVSELRAIHQAKESVMACV